MKMTDIATQMRGFYEQQLRSLNGIMEKLPEALRPEMETLRASLNEQLGKLGPLEQVPAAMDMGYAMQALSGCVDRITDYAKALGERLAGLQTKAVALHSFEGRIAAKELLAKADVDELVKLARQDERKTVEGALQPQITGLRTSMLQLAGLPAPGADILALTAPEFETRVGIAKKNADTAKARGYDLAGTKLVQRCAWKPEAEFLTELDELDALTGKKGGAGTLPARGGGHPLQGGERAADKPQAMARFAC